jgi:DNA-binding CsgD family transcriptional regulator
VRSWGLTAQEQDEVWVRWRQGESLRLIARRLGKRGPSVRAFVLQTGGVQRHPPRRARRCLSMAEREEISRGVAAGEPCRQIAARLGRAPSTVSRELARNGGRGRGQWWRPSWGCGGHRSRSPGGCRWLPSGSGDVGVARDDLSVAVHPEPRGPALTAAVLRLLSSYAAR